MGLKKDKDTVRFENFILMVVHEITQELRDQSSLFKSKELREELAREETQMIVNVVVVKTMSNLQKKRAFNHQFITSMFGGNMSNE
jgi:hypothetical protein